MKQCEKTINGKHLFRFKGETVYENIRVHPYALPGSDRSSELQVVARNQCVMYNGKLVKECIACGMIKLVKPKVCK